MREVVVWSGEIDLASVWDSQAAVVAALGRTDVSDVVIDLSEVTFMDSMGITGLLTARNTATDRGKNLALHGVSDRVARLLKMTGLDDLFAIVE